MEKEIKVILPAEDIPDYSTVTKLNGTKLYTLRKSIKIHDRNKAQPTEIAANDACVFLLAQDCATAIDCHEIDKELVWHTDCDALSNFFAEQIPY